MIKKKNNSKIHCQKALVAKQQDWQAVTLFCHIKLHPSLFSTQETGVYFSSRIFSLFSSQKLATMHSRVIYCGGKIRQYAVKQWYLCIFSKACFITAGPQQVTAVLQAFPCKFSFQSSVLRVFIVSRAYMFDDSKQLTAYALEYICTIFHIFIG